MAATRFYIPQMTRAKSDTVATEFGNYCLAGLDSNPDTYEMAAKAAPTIQIDMDYTSIITSYPREGDKGGASGPNPGINFAGVWLGPYPGNPDIYWNAAGGSLTVQSGTSYAAAITMGSIALSSLPPNGFLLIAEFAMQTNRYWKLVFTTGVTPVVREIFIGAYRDLTARWDWGGVPRGLRNMATIDELRGGHIMSRLERQRMPIRTERSYEFLSDADKTVIENAYEGAKGRHSPIIVADDGLSAYNGGKVFRFGDDGIAAVSVAHQLWNVSYSLVEVPVVGVLDRF